jgi:chemotaxis protein methyltransferase CheR
MSERNIIDDNSFQFFRELMEKRTSNSLDEDKIYLVETRLNPVSMQHGFESVGDMLHALRDANRRAVIAAPAIEIEIVEAMLVNETYFFRDPKTFDLLERELLPDCLKNRTVSHRLRIWSAAASTGQEAYSVAMLLHDRFPEIVANWSVDISASDLSRRSLDYGRAALYSDVEVGRGLTDSMKRNFLNSESNKWRVNDSVRSMVSFTNCHLGDRCLAGPWDVVFLRNVLIYFPDEVRRDILRRIHATLAHDGYLILGNTESIYGQDDLFSRTGGSVCCLQPK